MEVKVYTTPVCPWCKKVKEFLKANNVSYVEVNVSGNPEASKEMIKKSGQMGVPVLDCGGRVIVGFDENAIKDALKL